MQNPEVPYHDLTRIRGIGEARQRIFREFLNIYYYQDLARLDIDKAISLFRKKSEAVSREMLERWVKSAKTIDNELKNSTASRSSGYSLRIPESENGWQAFATFVVDYQVRLDDESNRSYRTTVHHMQADITQSWTDFDTSRYQDWIVQQLNESGYPENEKNKQKVHRYSANIDSIFLQSVEGEKKRIDVNKVITMELESSIRLELLLSLYGDECENIEIGSVNCKTRCFLQEHESKKIQEFSQTSPLQLTHQRNSYATFIENITLMPGHYRLWVSVILDSPSSIPHFKQLSHLKVMKNRNIKEAVRE